MVYKRHKYPVRYKALLHFDYPYPNSVAAAVTSSGCGGLRDEIGLCSWDIVGSVRFVGAESPAILVAGTPKFGWRCPEFGGANDYLRTGNTSGIWKLNSARNYELDLFVRPTSAAAGNILALRNSSGEVFVLSKTGENKLRLVSETFGLDRMAGSVLQQNVFSHVTVRLSQGAVRVFLNSIELFSQAVTQNKTLDVSEVRLGGFVGQIDEFRFAHAAGATPPVVPLVPFQGRLNIATVGGFGRGAYGDANIATPGNVQINSYAEVTALSGTTLTVGSVSLGLYGEFSGGDEVMIHLSAKKGAVEGELGFYAVRQISSIHGNTISLDRAIGKEFSAASAVRDYWVQLVKIPNYKTLTIAADTVLVPLLWDGAKGGLVALKTTGDCIVQGKIITEATGPRRTDSHALTHTDIAERFILTGNIFIACGGTLRTTESARLGAAHPGDGKGTVGFGSDGGTSPEGDAAGQKRCGKGGLPGRGGGGGKMKKSQNIGGIITISSGGGGGGGARGRGGNGQNIPNSYVPDPPEVVGNGNGEEGFSAPNVLIVAQKIAVSMASISTGGAGGGGGGCNSAAAHSTGNVASYAGSGGGGGGGRGGIGILGDGGKGGGGGGTSLTDGLPGTQDGDGGDGGIFQGDSSYRRSKGGKGCGAGYGGNGGEGGTGARDDYIPSPGHLLGGWGGGGGGGSGTGFCYIAYEEMI